MAEIEVVYTDGMFGFIKPIEFEDLIQTGGIVKFQRDGSWAYLGVNPTRSGQAIPGSSSLSGYPS